MVLVVMAEAEGWLVVVVMMVMGEWGWLVVVARGWRRGAGGYGSSSTSL